MHHLHAVRLRALLIHKGTKPRIKGELKHESLRALLIHKGTKHNFAGRMPVVV